MHHHLEIVMPPTDDVKEAVRAVMAPFNEDPQDGDDSYNAFWDWYVIGGRWAGEKFVRQFDAEKLQKFYDWLNEEEVTVSGLQMGKQEIKPASQIPKIDAKWQEMFDDDGPCPLFSHGTTSQYDDNVQYPDVMELKDVPEGMTCGHFIIATPRYESESKGFTGPPKAEMMLQTRVWNGVSFLSTTWDGSIAQAMEMYEEELSYIRKEDVKELKTPKDDWLVVTVDYHS